MTVKEMQIRCVCVCVSYLICSILIRSGPMCAFCFRNTTTLEARYLVEKIAIAILGLPFKEAAAAWRKVLEAHYQGHFMQEANGETSAGCGSLMSYAPLHVSQALYALNDLALAPSEPPLRLGDMLSSEGTSASSSSFAYASDKSHMQKDYEVLLDALAGDYMLVWDVLTFMFGLDDIPMISPQQRILYQEGMRADRNATWVAGNAKLAMKVLKYLKQPVGKEIVEKSDHEEWAAGCRQLLLGTTPESDAHSYPRLSHCKFGEYQNGHIDCGYVFHRTYSTSGLSMTFNAYDFWDLYKVTENARTFYTEIREKIARPRRYENSSYVPLNSENYGPASGVEFFVQLPLFAVPTVENRMHIAIHDPGEIPDLARQPIEIIPGRVYSIFITPRQIVADEGLRSLPVESRKCLFPDEGSHLRLFRNYTKQGCMFECLLHQAHEACNCTPWDYPHIREHSSLCDEKGTRCFSQRFLDPTALNDCPCPSACILTEYTHDYHFEDLLPNEVVCNEVLQRRHSAVHLLQDMRSRQERWDEVCEKKVRTVALVKIYLGSDTFQRITRHKRVTFSGQLSSIGNF